MRIEFVTFRTLVVAGLALLATACGPRRGGAPPKVPVSVARVERRALPYELNATGTVEPIRSVDVLPQVGGIILRVHFAEGDEVAAGQVLFEIDPRPYQAALQQAEGMLLRDLTTAVATAREAARGPRYACGSHRRRIRQRRSERPRGLTTSARRASLLSPRRLRHACRAGSPEASPHRSPLQDRPGAGNRRTSSAGLA